MRADASQVSPDDELWILIEELVDERISPAGRSRLETRLMAEPGAQDCYLACIDVHARLRWLGRDGGQAGVLASHAAHADLDALAFDLPPLEGLDPFEELLKAARQARSDHFLLPNIADSTRQTMSPALGFLTSAKQRVAASLVLLFVVCTAIFVWNYRPGRQSARTSLPPRFAFITAAKDCQWDQSDLAVGAGLGSGPQRLRSGVAKLQFLDGAEMIVEGPSSFELRSSGCVFVSNGRLVSHVPRRAFGFTVETHSGKIVDRGTDFVVDVVDDTQTRLAVTKGLVEVTTHDQQPARVAAGEAMRLSRRESESTAVRISFDEPWIDEVSGLERRLPADAAALVAYQAFPLRTPGNMPSFRGAVGLDFDVARPIRVLSLGVFDALGDGISADNPVTVQLWSRDNRDTVDDGRDDGPLKPLATLSYSSAEPGAYEFGHRFKLLPNPLDLPAGSYSIVAYNPKGGNCFIDLTSGKGTVSHVTTGDGAIVPLGSRLQAKIMAADFPAGTTRDRISYLAGSFKYMPIKLLGQANEENNP